jgi:hypothetical protein
MLFDHPACLHYCRLGILSHSLTNDIQVSLFTKIQKIEKKS